MAWLDNYQVVQPSCHTLLAPWVIAFTVVLDALLDLQAQGLETHPTVSDHIDYFPATPVLETLLDPSNDAVDEPFKPMVVSLEPATVEADALTGHADYFQVMWLERKRKLQEVQADIAAGMYKGVPLAYSGLAKATPTTGLTSYQRRNF